MSLTVSRADLFPAGTKVRAFSLPKQGIAEYRPVGEPKAPALFAEEATVNAAGEVTFPGLEAGTPYLLWANVGGTDHYLRARDSSFSEGLTRSPHAWVVAGAVAVENIPGPEIDPAAGEVQRLVRVAYRLREAETSTVTFTIQRNGVAIPGLENLVAKQAISHTTPVPVTLAAGDELSLNVTAVANVPKGLSVTLHLEHEPAE